MKLNLIAIAATAVLTSGIGMASAADNSAMSTPSTPPAQQSMAADSLSLTPAQQRTAWMYLRKQASRQIAPSGFTASVGATMPVDVALRPMPAKAASHVSSLKPYDYALLQGKLLIVNPSDRKVVDVITHRA